MTSPVPNTDHIITEKRNDQNTNTGILSKVVSSCGISAHETEHDNLT